MPRLVDLRRDQHNLRRAAATLASRRHGEGPRRHRAPRADQRPGPAGAPRTRPADPAPTPGLALAATPSTASSTPPTARPAPARPDPGTRADPRRTRRCSPRASGRPCGPAQAGVAATRRSSDRLAARSAATGDPALTIVAITLRVVGRPRSSVMPTTPTPPRGGQSGRPVVRRGDPSLAG